MKKSMIAILCLSTLIVSSMGITAVMHSDVSSGADTYDGCAQGDEMPTYGTNSMNNSCYEASVNGKYYEDIGDAIEAAMGIKATVIVLRNCTLDHTFTVPEGTELTLNLNNHVMICDKTLFYVESGNCATLTIDTGYGTIIAPGIIENHSTENYCGLEAYISGNFICSEKAFVFEDAKHVVFNNAHINSLDSAIWCSHKGCDVLEMYNSSAVATGEDAPSAVQIITRNGSVLKNCDITCDHNTALRISTSSASISGCNFIGGAFDFQHDDEGYLVGSPQATVVIDSNCSGGINCEKMSILFEGCTFSYVKSSFSFPPIIIAAAHNSVNVIEVTCKSLNAGGALCLFQEGSQNVTIIFNGVEHHLPA